MKIYFPRWQVLVLVFFLLPLSLKAQTFVEQTGIVLPVISNGSTEWGDYDNDGDLDLLVSGGGSDNNSLLKVFRNNGNNTFTDLGSVFSPALPLAYISYGDDYRSSWVDFNNDGFLDIIFDGQNYDAGHEVNIYKNEGNGTFTRKFKSVFLTFQGGSYYDCGDYDNDGDLDLLVVSSIASKVFKNLGNFSFSEQTTISLIGLTYSSCKWIDYDLDNDLDILLAGNEGTALYRNQGSNTFVNQTGITFIGGYGGTNDWGDYNNDGFPDLLLTGGSSSVYKNNGNNTFTRQSGIALTNSSKATSNWGDLDNDGDLDILITGNSNNTDITKVYVNNGNNSFTEATGVVLDGVSEGSADLGDYDNDGDLDIILSGKKGPNKICKIYKNTTAASNPLPVAPVGLTATISGNDMILKWNRVTSDNTASKALSYNLMAGTVTNGIDLVNPMSSIGGFRRIASIGNTQFDTAFALRNIKKGTYKWKVQAIDNSFKGGTFSSEGTFTYNINFQAYAALIRSRGGKEVALSWTRGNGDNCIVFAKAGSTGTAAPVNGTPYNANPIFGLGQQIGTSGWFCVYKGTSNSVTITGLTPLIDYIIQIQEFTGTSTYDNIVVPGQNSITFKTGIFTELTATKLPSINSATMLFVQDYDRFWFDFDNDNDLDIFITGPKGQFLYRNDGGNVFTKVTTTIGSGQYAECGDYNNDGNVDIAFINSGGATVSANNGNSTFTQVPGTSMTGTTYGSVDWADYDNDGDLDIIITGEAGSFQCITKIYRNNGNSTFTEISNHNLPGLRYSSTDWGDSNNDGLLELAISGITIDYQYITSIYGNDGKGSFVKITDLNNFNGLVRWGDYNNDGFLDILFIGSQNKIYRNNGNNTFTPQDQISLGMTSYGDGNWGDYNNDGYIDIVISGYAGSYSPFTKVFRNNTDNTFQEDLNCILTPGGFSSSAWADYDKDGDLDLLLTGVSADSAFTKLYRNDIAATNPVPAAPTGVGYVVKKSDVKLSWNSVRSDNTSYRGLGYNIRLGTTSGAINIVSPHASVTTGYRKIAEIGNANLDTTFYLKNLPLGTYYWRVQAVDNSFIGGAFSSENNFTIVPVQPTNLTAKILSSSSLLLKWERGNGYRCIVFSKEGSAGTAVPVNNKTYLQDAEYGYGEQIGSTGWYCVFNGRNDSVVVTGLKYMTDYSFHIIEYLGNPGSEQYFTGLVDGNPGVFSTGLFSEQTGITLSNASFNNFAWGDYNNDGFSDILIPGSAAKLYKNNGNNTFSQVAVFANGTYGSADWGDYDNDGDLDVLLTGGTGSYPTLLPAFSKIYRNDGAGTFTDQTLISLQSVYYSAADWGDYDNDGDLDLILTGATGNDPNFNPITKVYRNNGNGTFTSQDQISLPGVFRGDVKWVDYDNDGDLDIHLSGSLDYQYAQNSISRIYRNDGNNIFTWQNQIQFINLWEASTEWADYDNDGDLDVAMTRPGVIYVYKNTGGSFTSVFNKGYGYSSYGCVRWGDYDNDGYIDILFSNFAAAAIIFRNNGGQSFSEVNDASINFTQTEGLEWCDYDNDSDIDLLIYKWGDIVKLYRNNLFMKSGLFKVNQPPAQPVGLSFNRLPSGINLGWKPVTSDETKPATLSYNIKIGKAINNENVVPSHSTSTGFRKIVSLGNAQLDTTYLMKKMDTGKYYWKVQAVDQTFAGGAWSAVDSFIVKNVQAFFTFDTVCHGFPTHFTDQSVATDGIASRKWDFTDGSTSTLQNPVHQFASGGTFNVKLVVTSTGGVKDSLIKAVKVESRPSTGFTAPNTCQGTSVPIKNDTDNNGLTISSWYWNFGDGTNSVDQQPSAHGYLGPGNYTVTLIARATNGCIDTTIKTVTVVAKPVAAITTSTPLSFCEGDSVILSVTKSSNYRYEWKLDGTKQNNGDSSRFVAKLPGNYTVKVANKTAASCETTSDPDTVKIKPNPFKPIVLTENYTDKTCPGDKQIRLYVDQPVTKYSYQWFRNGSPLNSATSTSYQDYLDAGDYKVEVSLSGCRATSDIKKLEFPDAPPKPVLFTQNGPNVWYLVSSVTTASAYRWYFNGTVITGATGYFYVAGKNFGKYYVVISNDKGCYVRSDEVTIPTGTTGIDDVDPFQGLKIYPNPTTGLFTLEMDNQLFGNLNISVITQSGQQVLKIRSEKTTVNLSIQVDLSSQAKGIYFVKLQLDKYSTVKRVVLN